MFIMVVHCAAHGEAVFEHRPFSPIAFLELGFFHLLDGFLRISMLTVEEC